MVVLAVEDVGEGDVFVTVGVVAALGARPRGHGHVAARHEAGGGGAVGLAGGEVEAGGGGRRREGEGAGGQEGEEGEGNVHGEGGRITDC